MGLSGILPGEATLLMWLQGPSQRALGAHTSDPPQSFTLDRAACHAVLPGPLLTLGCPLLIPKGSKGRNRCRGILLKLKSGLRSV